LLALVWQSW